MVWVADIFAYFAGRSFGTRLVARKLAPSISPGKSWEGVWGGMVGVLLMACVWIWVDTQYAVDSQSLYTRLYSRGAPFLVLATLFLTLMSVAGDLVESLVKRSAGMKDSSQLLPGHGGVLDRVDAMLPTLPLALMETEPALWNAEMTWAMVWAVLVLTLGGSSLFYILIQDRKSTRLNSSH